MGVAHGANVGYTFIIDVLCNSLVVVKGIWSGASSLAFDDGNLHVLDLDPHQ